MQQRSQGQVLTALRECSLTRKQLLLTQWESNIQSISALLSLMLKMINIIRERERHDSSTHLHVHIYIMHNPYALI